MLALALKHGLKLRKVHRVMSFKEKRWLQDYVNLNTEKRKRGQSSIEKDFFKLMINSIFGKMIEQIEKRRNVKVVRAKDNSYRAIKHASHPYYKSCRIIENDKMILLETARESAVLDRPSIVGQAILVRYLCIATTQLTWQQRTSVNVICSPSTT